MKILLTNKQLEFLLNEAVDERYMDYLLDKMMGQGLTDEEQSDLQRMSRGEEISKDVPDNEEPKVSLTREKLPIQEPPKPKMDEPRVDIPKEKTPNKTTPEHVAPHKSDPERKSYKNLYQKAFFKLFPSVKSVMSSNQNIWGIDLDSEIFGDPVIVLSDGDSEIIGYCFYGASQTFMFKLSESNPQKTWVYQLTKEKPKNNNQMIEFINYFIESILPLIIAQIEMLFQDGDDEEFEENDPKIDEELHERGFQRIK